jgi:hypothetical protein
MRHDVDEWVATIRAMPAPLAAEDQLAAIMTRRAAGERVDLPVDLHPGIGLAVPVALAAMLAILLLGPALRRSPDEGLRLAQAGLAALGPEALLAQGSTDGPRFPQVSVADAPRLRPGRWVYQWRGIGPGSQVGVRRDSFAIRPAVFEGEPAWLLITHWRLDRPGAAMVDSAWQARNDLRPLAATMHVPAGSRLTTRFFVDSVVRLWERPDGSVEHTAAAVDGPPPWNSGLAFGGGRAEPVLFQLARLDRHWTGSVPHLGVANTRELVRLWFDYRVTGRERVEVPAGAFDAWKVESAYGTDMAVTYWVSVKDGTLVKSGLYARNCCFEEVLVEAAP